MMDIIQYGLWIGVFGVVSLWIGEGIGRISGFYREWNINGIFFRLLFGNLLMWAVFECITVPALLLRCSFDWVVWLWTAVIGVFLLIAFGGHRRLSGKPLQQVNKKKWTAFEALTAVLMICIVFLQVYMYVAYMHLDEDDVYFIGNAVNTLEYNTMSMSDYETGAVRTDLFLREGDAVCAWLYYFALLSRLTTVSPTVIAHTLLPVFLMIMMYAAYWLIADVVFDSDTQSCVLCVFFVALINMYFSGSAYTQSVFSLTRIWQGKAVAAAVIVPSIVFLVLFMNKNREDGRAVLLYTILNTAACSLSGMGILIAALSGGIYGVYYVAIHRKKRVMCFFAISLVPVAVLGSMYFLLSKYPMLFL